MQINSMRALGALNCLNTAFKGNKSDKAASNNDTGKTENVSLPYYLHPDLVKNTQKVQGIIKGLTQNDTPPYILDDINSLNEKEQKYFIEQYCKQTGLPDLKQVSENMRNHAVSAIRQSAEDSGVKVLWSGYHNHCSAVYDAALPGSDLDAMAVIVDSENQYQIDEFKGNMWRNFNPNLVSIRKDFEFPDVFSINQLCEWTGLVDYALDKAGKTGKAEQYEENKKETKDFEKALEFNIVAGNAVAELSREEIFEMAPSMRNLIERGETPRNMTQSMSSLLESLRSGKVLIPENLSAEQKEKMDMIKNSNLYKYGNICIQDAEFGKKDKLKAREEFFNNGGFEKLSQKQKMDLISKMIYESYPSWSKRKIETEYGREFIKMFDNGENVDESRGKAFSKAVDC